MFSAFAQQNLFGNQDIKSAVVNADNSVTFRFIAPEAQNVQVAGDFVAKVEDNPVGGMVGTGLADMTRDENGLWTLTTKPLPSELYSYLFVVDGIATADPNHPYVFRDFATISNVFIVGGGIGDLYKVNDVPHGSLTHRWYESESLGKDRRINIYTPPGYESSNPKIAAETVPGKSPNAVLKMAARYRIVIVAGLIEKAKDCFYITQIVAIADQRLEKYRKTDLGRQEREVFTAGDCLPVVRWHDEVAREVIFAIGICYDNNVPF